MTSNNRNIFSHSSGGRKSRHSEGHALPVGGESLHRSSRSWEPPVMLGCDPFAASCVPLLPLHLHKPVSCVSKQPATHKDTTHWIRDVSNPVQPHPNSLTSANALLPNKTTFTGARDFLTWMFWLRNTNQSTADYLTRARKEEPRTSFGSRE